LVTRRAQKRGGGDGGWVKKRNEQRGNERLRLEARVLKSVFWTEKPALSSVGGIQAER